MADTTAHPLDGAAPTESAPPPPPAPPAPKEEEEAPAAAPAEEAGPDLSWLPPGKKPLADGLYDAIVMGTGLKVCRLAGWSWQRKGRRGGREGGREQRGWTVRVGVSREPCRA
jgi:hypothetical protein